MVPASVTMIWPLPTPIQFWSSHALSVYIHIHNMGSRIYRHYHHFFYSISRRDCDLFRWYWNLDLNEFSPKDRTQFLNSIILKLLRLCHFSCSVKIYHFLLLFHPKVHCDFNLGWNRRRKQLIVWRSTYNVGGHFYPKFWERSERTLIEGPKWHKIKSWIAL